MLKNHQTKTKNTHDPVLVKEVIDCLNPQAGESYLDLTAGYGGHAETVLARTEHPQKATLVDRDEEAIAKLESKFRGARVIHSDFKSALEEMTAAGQEFDLIMADLGTSSPHFDKPERGFAFSAEGPLDMRMDRRQELTAESLVNAAPEEQLAKMINDFGEERRAKQIARRIVAARPLTSTKQLAEVVVRAYGPIRRRGKIHPATKTFQALRIGVNQELDQLAQSLPLMGEVLAPGGRLAIISFHSLEDRLVKQFLNEMSGDRYDSEFTLLTKKPLTAGPDEIAFNPRARSAKLRAAAKIKNRKDQGKL